MAKHSQSHQGASKKGGGRQAVVELCGVTHCGLMFWSRQRFEIGAELQLRIRRDALPASLQGAGIDDDDWLTMSGYVVECPAIRREDGSHGFRISLLFDSALQKGGKRHELRNRDSLRFTQSLFPGQLKMGLN